MAAIDRGFLPRLCSERQAIAKVNKLPRSPFPLLTYVTAVGRQTIITLNFAGQKKRNSLLEEVNDEELK